MVVAISEKGLCTACISAQKIAIEKEEQEEEEIAPREKAGYGTALHCSDFIRLLGPLVLCTPHSFPHEKRSHVRVFWQQRTWRSVALGVYAGECQVLEALHTSRLSA